MRKLTIRKKIMVKILKKVNNKFNINAYKKF